MILWYYSACDGNISVTHGDNNFYLNQKSSYGLDNLTFFNQSTCNLPG
jgi:hypothetical protein